MNTLYEKEELKALALKAARGDYQRLLLQGQARWSGADLTGKAAKYGGSYASSRARLKERLRELGLRVEEIKGEHNRRVVVIGGHK
jgi:hypothetical protein